MKKLITATLFIFLCNLAFAQEEKANYEKSETKLNEVKLNTLYTLLGSFEASYEFLVSDQSGFGVSVMLPFDDAVVDWDYNYAVTGYYRYYFMPEGQADLWFAEAFLMFNSIDDRVAVVSPNGNRYKNPKQIEDVALGLSAGYKYVTDFGLVIEAYIGGGRNLFKTYDGNRDYNFLVRGSLGIGYRF
ncbi:MAG: DUF3575 domain-containing protein [Bacteroidota bacterium]